MKNTTHLKKISFYDRPIASWFVWFLGTLFYCYEFFIQVSPSVMGQYLVKDFHITATELGQLGAVYFYAYSFMQIPVGVLLDHFGTRKLLTLASALCALGCYFFSTASHLATAEAGRFLMGIGSAFGAVSCLNLASKWFPAQRFALLVGIMLSVGMLGAVAGETPLALLVHHLGWRQSNTLLAIIGIALAIFLALFLRDAPNHQRYQANKKDQLKLIPSIIQVFKNPQSWIISFYAGLIYAVTPALGGLWGVPFLIKVHGLTHTQAATAVSFLFIGWIIGSPLFGAFSDFIQKRRPPLIISSIGTLITLLIFIYLPYQSIFFSSIIVFFIGFFSSAFLPAFSAMREINPPKATATAMGFMNALNSLGAALLQPIIGFILDKLWQHESLFSQDGIRFYSSFHYQVGLSIIPIFIVISLFILPWIQETHCLHANQKKEIL